MKSSIKNSIIEDYVVVKSISNLFAGTKSCENDVLIKIESKAETLLRIYEMLIFKFNLMDLSFFLLNKEIEKLGKYGGLDDKLKNLIFYDNKLNEVESKLIDKLKKLRINEFEANFLISNKGFKD